VVQVNEQDVVIRLAQSFERELRRAHAIHQHALRLQQQLHGFEDMRLVVGYEYSDLWLLVRNVNPPQLWLSPRRSNALRYLPNSPPRGMHNLQNDGHGCFRRLSGACVTTPSFASSSDTPVRSSVSPVARSISTLAFSYSV